MNDKEIERIHGAEIEDMIDKYYKPKDDREYKWRKGGLIKLFRREIIRFCLRDGLSEDLSLLCNQPSFEDFIRIMLAVSDRISD